MDVALANSIVNTATALASAKTSDALNMVVLKKALDMQAVSAATMLDALQQSMPEPAVPVGVYNESQVDMPLVPASEANVSVEAQSRPSAVYACR